MRLNRLHQIGGIDGSRFTGIHIGQNGGHAKRRIKEGKNIQPWQINFPLLYARLITKNFNLGAKHAMRINHPFRNPRTTRSKGNRGFTGLGGGGGDKGPVLGARQFA